MWVGLCRSEVHNQIAYASSLILEQGQFKFMVFLDYSLVKKEHISVSRMSAQSESQTSEGHADKFCSVVRRALYHVCSIIGDSNPT